MSQEVAYKCDNRGSLGRAQALTIIERVVKAHHAEQLHNERGIGCQILDERMHRETELTQDAQAFVPDVQHLHGKPQLLSVLRSRKLAKERPKEHDIPPEQHKRFPVALVMRAVPLA